MIQVVAGIFERESPKTSLFSSGLRSEIPFDCVRWPSAVLSALSIASTAGVMTKNKTKMRQRNPTVPSLLRNYVSLPHRYRAEFTVSSAYTHVISGDGTRTRIISFVFVPTCWSSPIRHPLGRTARAGGGVRSERTAHTGSRLNDPQRGDFLVS